MSRSIMKTVIVAFALALLLAVSSFAAYSINLYGNVEGLEDGVEYTCAKYDFAANSYGEYVTLTKESQLFSGVWAIKAGDSEPEVVFVGNKDNGQINFWNFEANVPLSGIYAKSNTYIPGKWTFCDNGIIRTISAYGKNDNDLIMYVLKEKYNTQAEVKTAKTVTVEGAAYPVYIIGEAEYYLKDEAYYSVADNVLFEGDASGAEAAFDISYTWINAEPIIDTEVDGVMTNNNRLQETYISYGFTEEQIIPANGVVEYAPEHLTSLKAGGMAYGKDDNGKSYTAADIKGTFTFIVKTPGVEGEERFTVDTAGTDKSFKAPAEMAESNGYLVAIEYAPFAKCPDDIFHGTATDKSSECYSYLGMHAGVNEITFIPQLPKAPVVYDGMGVIGIENEDANYEIAPVTLDASGTGLTVGEWTPYSYSITAPRSLSGLYAVREVNGDRYSDYAVAYATGDKADRENIGHLTENGYVEVMGTTDFAPGLWTGKWNGNGIATHSTFGKWAMGTLGGQVSRDHTVKLQNALAGNDAEALLAAQTTVANLLNAVNYRYAYTSTEVVKTSEADKLTFSFKMNNARIGFSAYTTKVIAYVVTKSGEVETYTVEFASTQAYDNNTVSKTINFAEVLPADGYLVGLEIFPTMNIKPEYLTSVKEVGNTRYLLTVDPANYYIKDAAAIPTGGAAPEGLKLVNGVITGLNPDKLYEIAQFSINGIAPTDWTSVPVGSTEIAVDFEGLAMVRYAGDGYSTSGSDSAAVYIGGTKTDILHLVDAVDKKGNTIQVPEVVRLTNTDDNIYTVKFNAGKWSGIFLTNELAISYDFNPLVLGTTGTPIAHTLAKNLQTAAESGDAEAIATARAEAAKKSDAIYYSYEFLPEEIMKMTDFDSFTFTAARRQSGFNVVGDIQTKLVLKVVTPDGQLVDRAAYKKTVYDFAGTTHTFTIDDFEETDGYLVGIVIHPYVLPEGSYLTCKDAETNGDYMLYLKKDGFKATRRLDPAPTPVLTFDNGVITGFDAEYNYEYSPYTYNGASQWTDVEGAELAVEEVGLIAVRAKTDGKTYENSAMVVFYNPGKYSERKALFEYDESGKVVSARTSDFIEGTLTATRLSYVNDGATLGLKPSIGANLGLDQQVGAYGNVADAEKLWLLQRTKEEAQAVLDAEKDFISKYNESGAGSYYPQRLQAEIDKFYAVENRDIQAEILEIGSKANAYLPNTSLIYTYTNKEIVPVNELLTISFVNRARQGAFEFVGKSAARFHVVDNTGKITAYTWYSEEYLIKRHTTYTHTVDVQSIEGLPSEGWVVAVEFIPYAEVVPSSIVSVSSARIAYQSQAWAFDQQHVVMGIYHTDYAVTQPVLEKPDAVYADGKFTGLDADKTYGYGRFTPTGVVDMTSVTGVTELAVPGVGLWGLCRISTDTEFGNSEFVVGYNKDMTEARENILNTKEVVGTGSTYKDKTINVPIVSSRGGWDGIVGAAPVFIEGTWVGYNLNNSLATAYGYNPLTLGTTGGAFNYSHAGKAIKEATTETELKAARDYAAKVLGTINYAYQYKPDQVIPMNEFISWEFYTAERQGTLTVLEGTLQTKFVFKVVTEDGKLEDRVVYKDAKFDKVSNLIEINIQDFKKTDGYIVGMVIYPFGNCPEGTVIGCDAYTDMQDFTVTLTDSYEVFPAVPVQAETPVIEVATKNAVITVTNYNPFHAYAYSADNGETWTSFEGNKFNATKASTEYIVKALENQFFGETEVSNAVTSPAVTVAGTSLVLDGQIGIKVYMDIDTELVDSVLYNTTKVNRDYAASTTLKEEYRKSDYVSFTRSLPYMTAITFDEESGLYYTIAYVPAKDVDNTTFEVDLGIFLKSAPNTRVQAGNAGFSFTNYIEQAKTLAAEGNEMFADALPLVEALETYTTYADAYFNEKTVEAYESEAEIDVEAPSKTGTLAGAEFYGTSIILEDQVTIRHYFIVTDEAAFVGGQTGTKNGMVYFDITDIPAQDIGKAQTLTVGDYTVSFSVANYLADAVDSEDANLASLANAMYDYYLAAAEYNK